MSETHDTTTNDALRSTMKGQRQRSKPRFGIRLLVTLVGVGITVLAVLSVGAIQERDTRRTLTSELEARALLEARNLALTSSRALLDDFPELTLQPLLTEKQKRQPELELLVVADRDGQILGHPDQRLLGNRFEIATDALPHATQRRLQADESMLANTDLLIALAPIEYLGQTLGRVAVGIQKSYIDQLLHEARMRQAMILLVVLAFAGLIVYGSMTKLLLPIDALRRGVERIGRGDLETPIAVDERTEIGLLADSVNEMAADLKQAQADMVEKERLARELELAREIQSGLLPENKQESGSFLIDGTHEAAFEVGGDFYDFFNLPDGRIGVAVADVAGKGLAGCLVMSMLSALLGAFRDQYDSPSELLAKLDERLVKDLMSGSFVTMFYGILDPEKGKMCFASAGHMPTLVFRKNTGAVEEYRTKGIPLGAIKGGAIRRTLHDEWVDLADGDLLVQYTDGINETMDPEGHEQFDLPRMHNVVSDAAETGAGAVISNLITAIADFRGDTARLDDETIVVVSRELAGKATMVDGGSPALIAGPTQATPSLEIAPNPAPNVPAEEEAVAWVVDAQRRGIRLDLQSDLDGLSAIRGWLEGQDSIGSLKTSVKELIWTAVYEACANVAEHGYGATNGARFYVWWLSDLPTPQLSLADVGAAEAAVDEETSEEHGTADEGSPIRGRFVLLDRGRPFSPDNWSGTDFSDPKVWRKGRGFGLDIIHRVMTRVVYRPGTRHGNVTLLCFDSTQLEKKELTNVRGL